MLAVLGQSSRKDLINCHQSAPHRDFTVEGGSLKYWMLQTRSNGKRRSKEERGGSQVRAETYMREAKRAML